MKHFVIFLLSYLFLFPFAALAGEKSRFKVPQKARAQFQKMWKEERAEKIYRATAYLGISCAASYAF